MRDGWTKAEPLIWQLKGSDFTVEQPGAGPRFVVRRAGTALREFLHLDLAQIDAETRARRAAAAPEPDTPAAEPEAGAGGEAPATT